MFIRYNVVGNAQARNRHVVDAPGPVHVQGCKKQGKSRQWVQRGVWCTSQCSSVLFPLLFIIVLEALSREYRTGCQWELLYTDDLMISAGFMSMEELLVKLKTWKSEIMKVGLQVNMGKTKNMVSVFDLEEIWKGFLRCLSEKSR